MARRNAADDMTDSAPQLTESSARLIKVGDKSFVTDLIWEALASPATAKRDVAAYAKKFRMNLSTVYSGIVLQAGYAFVTEADAKRYANAWCLASILASKLGTKWLGIFTLGDDEFVAVAVYDGRIVPGCDIHGDRVRMEDLITELGATFTWDAVYIQDEALAGGFNPELVVGRPLSDILTDRKFDREHRIKLHNPGVDPKTLMLGTGAVLVALTLVGYNYWRNQQAAELAALDDANNAASTASRVDKQRRDAQALVDSRTIQPGWPAEPKAVEVVSACRQAIFHVPLSVGGWALGEAHCSAQGASAVYTRVDGVTMLDFERDAQSMKTAHRLAAFDTQADKAVIRMPFATLAARGFEDVPRYPNWMTHWVSLFQAIGITSTLAIKPHPAPPAPDRTTIAALGEKKSVPPPPWWDTYTWKFSTKTINAFDILDRITGMGMVVKSISIKSNRGAPWEWSAEGEINVRP